MINIVLLEPEMPANTGNIGRTCCATGTRLHLIEPMGFKINDKMLKRAGLDYWDKLDIITYENLNDFKSKVKSSNIYLFSTKSKKVYSDVSYEDEVYLIFGPETRGLPEDYIYENFEHSVRIPMREGLRSLNLSNSVAIAAYEVERQHSFKNLEKLSKYFD